MLQLSSLNLSRLVKEKKAFVLYREAGMRQAYFIEGLEVIEASSFEALDSNQSFVFAPFEQSKCNPLLIIKGKQEALDCNYPLSKENKRKESKIFTSKEKDKVKYTEHFSIFKEALEENAFKKLVLARSKDINLSEDLDIKSVFAQMIKTYKTAFCYLIYTAKSGLWLGASPECLLSVKQNTCSTVALAGTQIIEEGNQANKAWSEKLQEEQGYVLDFIEQSLNNLGIEAQKSKPYTALAGNLAHLKTDINFTLNKEVSIGKVLQNLHPTPALCGLAKDEAKAFILENEGLERAYYGGFFGFINQDEATKLYVNIRCVQVLSGRNLRLYAGGGLLKSSILEEEWQETEAKMETMQKLL